MEVEPDFSGPLEIAGEAQGGVGSDSALAFNDLIDATRGNADFFGDAVF